MKNIKSLNRKVFIVMSAIVAVAILFSGCEALNSFMNQVKGQLVGQSFKIMSYDDYGNNTMTLTGRKNVNISVEGKSDKDDATYQSEVLCISISGHQLLHVGSTLVFAENGIDMVKDYDINYMKNAEASGNNSTGFIPFDRTINGISNLIGKKKTVVIRSQMGILIGVYQGDSVNVTIPTDLPKMTLVTIDGKSLYIHRADYDIYDTGLLT